MANIAMFAGLVFDENERPVEISWVGSDACYVVDDGDFRRHIDAEQIDRQVLRYFKGQVEAHRDVAVRGMLQMLGKDDIFSKTAVEYQIDRMDETVGQAIPEQAKQLLGSMGFQIVIDFHGEIIEVRLPEEGVEDY